MKMKDIGKLPVDSEFKLKELQKFILERTKYVIQKKFSESFLSDIKYSTSIDNEIKGIILRLEKDILSDKVVTEVKTFNYPDTWWDHFKLDHFPLWLYEKYPAKFKVKKITFKRTTTYPKLALAMRDDERFKEFYVWESMTEEDE